MPPRFAPVHFGFVLSGFMSSIVSGIAAFRNTGVMHGFPALWSNARLPSRLNAFPVGLVVAPLARRVVSAAVRPVAGATR